MSESTINILFLAAVPKGVAPLSIDKEYREIEDVLEESPQGMRFRLFRHAKVQRPELERTLSTFQPHIVHFAGHGSENGSLLVEGTDGNRWELDRDTIRTIFKAYGQSVKMAVLNACYSEVTANVLRESVSYVVANSIAVFDEHAITFSKTFYSTLFKDETLNKCFREALKAVQDKDPQGALTPQLLTTPSSPDPRTIKPLSSWLRVAAQAPSRSVPRLEDLMPPGSTATRAEARKALEKYLPLVDDFNRFIAEEFPETFARFGGGMNRVACTTLVIQLHSPEEILHQLAAFLTAGART